MSGVLLPGVPSRVPWALVHKPCRPVLLLYYFRLFVSNNTRFRVIFAFLGFILRFTGLFASGRVFYRLLCQNARQVPNFANFGYFQSCGMPYL